MTDEWKDEKAKEKYEKERKRAIKKAEKERGMYFKYERMILLTYLLCLPFFLFDLSNNNCII